MKTVLLIVAVLAYTLQLPALAQEAPAVESAVTVPADALDRGTPRRAVGGFMRAFERGDLATAADYLDLRELPPRYRNVEPGELARQLGIVFSREVWINATQLSDEPDGAIGDGLPANQDRLATIRSESGDAALLLQRVERDDGALIWKISNATVAQTADLYADFGYGPVVEAVAAYLPAVSILGVELFKWVLALGAGLIAYPLLLGVAWLITRMRSSESTLSRERLFRYLAGPASLVVTILVMDTVLYQLGLGVTARKFAEGRTVLILLLTWLVLATANLARDLLVASLRKQGREGAIVLQRPTFAAIKIVIVVTAAVTWLDNIGYNVTTLLASLGVGGIAVALALQKPMEDVFGAFTLYNQQPIRVGDFCRFGDTIGFVEEIGLRTTRIRTPANTLVSVPNARIAGEKLENFSARRKILYNPTLRLRSDTPPEVLRRVLDGIRDMLANHDKVIQENPRVRFERISVDALEIGIFAYLDTVVWPEYLALAEDINLRVLEAIAAAGTGLALPARSLILEQAGDRRQQGPQAAGDQWGEADDRQQGTR